jgi:hypothetical protein
MRLGLFVPVSLGLHAAVCAVMLLPRVLPTGTEVSVLAGNEGEGAEGTVEIAESEPESESATFDPTVEEPAPSASDGAKRAQMRPAKAAGAGAQAGSTAMYGAVGVRSAVDLTYALVRALPQVASTDAAWARTGLGSNGNARVTLTLSDDGHITAENVHGGSPELRTAIARALTLLRARPFTARGKVTVLTVRASVAADTVHDGLHGDVYAVGASAGHGFFALAIGRRVDITVSP